MSSAGRIQLQRHCSMSLQLELEQLLHKAAVGIDVGTCCVNQSECVAESHFTDPRDNSVGDYWKEKKKS